MKWLLTVAAFLFLATSAAPCQAIKRAYCGDNATLHILYVDGSTRSQPKEPQQVACDNVVVANDGHTVGWSVLVPNCCTSYPIAASVAVLQNHRKRVISADQTVWKWRFVNDATQLAILSGPTHGGATVASLYDLRTGRPSAQWNGTGAPPSWASGWQDDFAPPDGPPTQPK